MAAENPDAIVYEPIDISKGLQKSNAIAVAKKVGLEEHAEETATMLLNMYDMFCKKDALLVEINPYAEDANESCKFLSILLYFHKYASIQVQYWMELCLDWLFLRMGLPKIK